MSKLTGALLPSMMTEVQGKNEKGNTFNFQQCA
jgi:hypothetical protein